MSTCTTDQDVEDIEDLKFELLRGETRDCEKKTARTA